MVLGRYLLFGSLDPWGKNVKAKTENLAGTETNKEARGLQAALLSHDRIIEHHIVSELVQANYSFDSCAAMKSQDHKSISPKNGSWAVLKALGCHCTYFEVFEV